MLMFSGAPMLAAVRKSTAANGPRVFGFTRSNTDTGQARNTATLNQVQGKLLTGPSVPTPSRLRGTESLL